MKKAAAKIFLNKRLVKKTLAKIPVSDMGVHYGDGLFETMKAYKGTVFLFDEHMKRLEKGIKFLGIEKVPGPEEIKKNIFRLVRANGLASVEARIKLILTRGRGMMPFTNGKTPTLIITAEKVKTFTVRRMQKNGITAIISKGVERPLGKIKSLNHLVCVIAKRKATKKNADEAILATKDGLLLEGATTNIFIVKRGILLTPPLSLDILPGITRKAVLKIARANKIRANETHLTVEDLEAADEAFLTNSIIGIVPLKKAGRFKTAKGAPAGKITKILQAGYKKLVKSAPGGL